MAARAAFARELAERNGGTLTFAAAAAAKGAAFTVKFPVLRAVPAPVEPGPLGRRAMAL